jgi:Uma2 family endonuclease
MEPTSMTTTLGQTGLEHTDLGQISLAKWSVDDYHRMISAGILCDRPVELLQGNIVEMAPEKPIHYYAAEKDSHYLKTLLANKAQVRFNGPITLQDSEPEPDIAIVRMLGSVYASKHPAVEDIYWLIEVANSSLKIDLGLKAEIYAAANIPEYWVIDLANRQLIAHTEPRDRCYTQKQHYCDGFITPLAFSDIQVSVAKLINS